MNKLLLTVLPFGTGNDLARSFGWGCFKSQYVNDLDYVVRSLIHGKRERFAIWKVEFDADETQGYYDGKLSKISKEGENFEKIMCCYFNIGLDALISNSKLEPF